MPAVPAGAEERVWPCRRLCFARLSGAVPRALHRRGATEERFGFGVRATLHTSSFNSSFSRCNETPKAKDSGACVGFAGSRAALASPPPFPDVGGGFGQHRGILIPLCKEERLSRCKD